MSALPLAPLDAFLKDLGLSLSDEQADLLARFYELVSAANSRFNLTAVTDAESFVTKHYIDSVSSADIFPAGAKILDLGAGAGLPSVPLAIVRPDIFVTALDARAEERGDLFSKFDFVTARAVTSLSALVELALPLLKKGGRLVAYKTPADDPKDAAHALSVLGGGFDFLRDYSLPGGSGERRLLVFKKLAETPHGYPRKWGVIKNRPL